MRTYICTSCAGSIIVGHPTALFQGQATALARAGAKVLHPRTLEPLEGAGIPVFVGNTLRPGGPGTWIGPSEVATEEAQEAGTAA